MAITSQAVASIVKTTLISSGFDLTNQFSRANDFIDPVCKSIVDIIHATAVVVVPAHAGGKYKVTKLSADMMQASVITELTAKSMTSGNHSKPFEFGKAIARATTMEILAKSEVSIPTDAGGVFQIIGLDVNALDSMIKIQLGADFVLTGPHSKPSVMTIAFATGITNAFNSLACVSGSFVAGGVFPVL